MGPRLAERRFLSFWPLQLGGWLLYTAASAVALIPSHAQEYLAYRITYLTVGFLGTFGMYFLCHGLRRARIPLFKAIACCAGVGYLLSIPTSAAITWAEIRFGGSKATLKWDTVLANAVGVMFLYVAWSAFYFGIKHYQDLEEHRSRLIASEALAREAQLRALRYQLQPHFLFNTLNAISTLVLDNQPRIATQMIAKLASLLRTTLDSPEAHQVSLAEELAITEEYLAIEQVRLGPALSVEYRIETLARNAQVPRFLLQPLIENAVQHGIAKRRGGGCILVRAHIEGDALALQVENESRIDISEQSAMSQAASSSGLGLSNTRLRLEQLYGSAATLRTERVATGNFNVAITIPLYLPDDTASRTPEVSL